MLFGLPQSRLAASLVATIFTMLYMLAFSPTALAAELPVNIGANDADDYNIDLQFGDTYEPSFAPFDSSYLGRRASVIGPLVNNMPVKSNLNSGEAACYQLKKAAVFTGTRDSAKNGRSLDFDSAEAMTNSSSISARQSGQKESIFISANTCLQPYRVPGDDKANIESPQLTLLISNSSQLGCPDMSMQDTPNIQRKTLEEGAIMLNYNFTDDLFISIQAPNVSSSYQGVYFFELAFSTQDYYHRYESKDGQLLWLDSDASSALLVSKNLTTDPDETKQIMEDGELYEFYIDNELFPRLHGLGHSRCGLQTNAQIYTTPSAKDAISPIHMTMTTRGPGGLPKQQFFVTGLNDTTEYRGFIVKAPNTTAAKRDGEGIAGGGGTVYASTTFNTVSGNYYSPSENQSILLTCQ